MESNTSKNSIKMIIIDLIIAFIGIVIDQVTKVMVTPLKESGPVELIKDVLEFHYHENKGAAFGMLQGQRIFFIVIAVVLLAVMIFVFIRIPAEKKYIKLNICLAFTLAGAIGNTIDRGMLSYVRDFVYFKIIDFPIFNVADIYITVSMFLLAVMIIFCYKDDDFAFLSLKKKKESE